MINFNIYFCQNDFEIEMTSKNILFLFIIMNDIYTIKKS